jgi:hypothetical protein
MYDAFSRCCNVAASLVISVSKPFYYSAFAAVSMIQLCAGHLTN